MSARFYYDENVNLQKMSVMNHLEYSCEGEGATAALTYNEKVKVRGTTAGGTNGKLGVLE